MVGLITNSPASVAAKNLNSANASSETSIARLSSGNRIISASDDVAGLAVGTLLKTNLSTMRAALTNASQGQSLLGVADGALDNIGQILQRQKALASQSTSGSLSDQARGYLNDEFIALKEEIDRISINTNFNHLSLLDGSIYNSASIKTDITTQSSTLNSTIFFQNSITANEYIQLFSSDATTPQGVSRDSNGNHINIRFTSIPTGSFSSAPQNLLQFDGTASASSAAKNFMNMINNLKLYNGNDPTTLYARGVASAFDFSYDGSRTLTITSKTSGSAWNQVDIIPPLTNNSLKINGISNVGNGAISFATNGISGINGSLPSGDYSTGGSSGQTGFSVYTASYNAINNFANGITDIVDVPSTYALGITSDPLLNPIDPLRSWTTGVNLSGIANNPSFVGRMGQFDANYEGLNTINLHTNVGGIDYVANGVLTNYVDPTGNNNPQTISFQSTQSGYGSFILQFASGNGLSVSDEADTKTYMNRLNSSISGIDIFQRRQVSTYKASGSVFPTGSTIASGSLSGSAFYLISNNFTNIEIQDIEVIAPAGTAANAQIQISMNGKTFVSGYGYDGSSLPLSNFPTANTFTNNGGVNNDGLYGLVNKDNPSEILVFKYSSSTPLSITSQGQAEGLAAALKTAFGVNTGTTNGGLLFQVGNTTSDVIEIQIPSSKTEYLYVDNSGNSQSITVDTAANAKFAQGVIDNAINSLITIRANVGAYQSRLTFAEQFINTSIENLDAGRSLFLDADISYVSSELAQAQIRMQASISVLAQANQIPVQLLKLLS